MFRTRNLLQHAILFLFCFPSLQLSLAFSDPCTVLQEVKETLLAGEQASWETIHMDPSFQSSTLSWIHCSDSIIQDLLYAQKWEEAQVFFSNMLPKLWEVAGPDSFALWKLQYHSARSNLFYTGDLEAAYQEVSRALLLLSSSEVASAHDALRCYYLMGTIATNQGELDNAQQSLMQALEVAESTLEADSYEMGVVLNSLGKVCFRRSQYEAAISYFEKCRAIFYQYRSHKQLAYVKSLQNLAVCLPHVERYQQAERLYQEALAILKTSPTDQSRTIRSIYQNLGLMYLEIGAYEKAETYFQLGIELSKQIKPISHELIADANIHLSKLEYQRQDLLTALAYAHEAASLLDSTIDRNHLLAVPQLAHLEKQALWSMYHVLQMKAKILKDLHQDGSGELQSLQSALAHYEEIGHLYHLIRRNLPTEADQLLLPDILDDRNELISKGLFCARTLHLLTGSDKYLASAFYLMEQSKGMIGLEQMLSRTFQLEGQLPTEALAIGDSLLESIYSLSSHLRRVSSVDKAELRKEAHQLVLLRQTYRHWKDTLRINHPLVRSLLEGYEIASLSEIQQFLSIHGGIWISYHFSGPQTGMILAIDAKATELIPIDLATDFEQQITSWKRLLSAPDMSEEAWQDIVGLGESLYQQLLAPVDARISLDHQGLIIVPDGILNGVSFAPMLKGTGSHLSRNYRGLPYLIRDHAISYVHSATALLEQIRFTQPLDSYHCLGMAYSEPSFPVQEPELYTFRKWKQELPGSSEEIQFLQKILTGNYYWGSSATEAQFRSQLGKAQIHHLAIHGLGSIEQPYLLFPGADSLASPHEDGILTLDDLATLSLQSHLSVLSACETGMGSLHQNEGIISIARGFQSAGSASVVMNLWRAHDASSVELMKVFYQGLLENQSKSQALRQAQLHYLTQNNNLLSHPAYWSGLVVWGNPNALPLTSPLSWSWLLASMIAFLAVLVWYFRANYNV